MENRCRKVLFRLTEQEYQTVLAMATSNGRRGNLSEYVRNRVLGTVQADPLEKRVEGVESKIENIMTRLLELEEAKGR